MKVWRLTPWLAILISGCSVTYIDADGGTRRLGFLSITEEPGACSLVRTVTTAGITLDTTSATGGFNLGYKTLKTVQPPSEGAVAFEIGDDEKLVFYERFADADSSTHMVCGKPSATDSHTEVAGDVISANVEDSVTFKTRALSPTGHVQCE